MVAPTKIGARLLDNGTLITAGEFDAYNTSPSGAMHSITRDIIYADDLDEVTLSTGFPSGGSVNLNGSTQYLGIAGTGDFQFGTGDFTIEGWFFLRTTGFTRLWSFPDGDNLEVSGSALYYWNGVTPATSGSSVIPQNQWFHIALVKSSGVVTAYVNGASKITDSVPFNSTSSRPLAIGGEVTAGLDGYLDGNVANFRVVKGTAVYTAGFSTPVTPLTAVTNTKLLLKMTTQANLLTDSSGTSKSVTNIGGASFSAATPLTTIYNGAMKQLKNGTLRVANEFDEVTEIV